MSDRTFEVAIVVPALVLLAVDVVGAIRERRRHREAMAKLREDLRRPCPTCTPGAKP